MDARQSNKERSMALDSSKLDLSDIQDERPIASQIHNFSSNDRTKKPPGEGELLLSSQQNLKLKQALMKNQEKEREERE